MAQSENTATLKARDYDKYLATIFTTGEKREQLAALFTFHHEISQVPVEVSEPMIGMVKFQWWRDVLEEIQQGKPSRPHPILLGLKGSGVDYAKLSEIIDSYEKLLDGWQPKTVNEIEQFVRDTECIIFTQAAKILGRSYNENLATAYGLTSIARKLLKNSKQENVATALIDKSTKLTTTGGFPRWSVFGIITRHYNAKPSGNKYSLLLKLAILAKSPL